MNLVCTPAPCGIIIGYTEGDFLDGEGGCGSMQGKLEGDFCTIKRVMFE